MILKNDIKYEEMEKNKVLTAIANIRTSWSMVSEFIEGIPPHWFKKSVKHIMKNNVDFNNVILLIEKSLKLRLKDIYFSLDVDELNGLIKRSKTLHKEGISLSLELKDNESAYIKGEKEIENDKGDIIKVSPGVINQTIKDIRADIFENRKNMKNLEEEERAMALLLRKKYF